MEHYLFCARHGLLFLLLIVCAYTDISKGKVYNWCTLGAIGLGLAISFLADGFASRNHYFVESVIGLCLGGGVFLIPFLFGGIGGGDVKLMAAVGALAGRPGGAASFANWFALWAMLYSALVGAALALGILVWQGKLLEGLRGSLKLLVTFRARIDTSPKQPDAARVTVPYGFAISVGTFWAWFTFLQRGLLHVG